MTAHLVLRSVSRHTFSLRAASSYTAVFIDVSRSVRPRNYLATLDAPRMNVRVIILYPSIELRARERSRCNADVNEDADVEIANGFTLRQRICSNGDFSRYERVTIIH